MSGTKGRGMVLETDGLGKFFMVPHWLIVKAPTPNALAVYVAMGYHHANWKTGECWPSKETLAAKVGVSVRTLTRALNELRDLGALTWRSTGRENIYTLRQVCAGRSDRADLADQTGQERAPNEDLRNVDVREPTPPAPPSEPDDLEPDGKTASAQAPSEVVRRVFDAWIEATGKTARTKLDAKRRRLIVKALKHYELDEVLDAVRGWRNSPHHRGESNGTIYNDLGLLLRDAEHIERFRDLERAGPPRRGPRQERNIDRDRSAPTGRVDSL